MRLHVDLFIKYVSNNVYSDNNHGQPQSILNIFHTFFSSLHFMTTFCGLFSVWYWYHCFFFCWAGWKWVGRRDCLTIFFFFYLVGSPKVGGAGDGKHKKKYGHPNIYQVIFFKLGNVQRFVLFWSNLFWFISQKCSNCNCGQHLFFYLVGSPKVGGAGDGKHKKNTATLIYIKWYFLSWEMSKDLFYFEVIYIDLFHKNVVTNCGLHLFFYLVGSPKVGGAGDGKHKKKYGHPNIYQVIFFKLGNVQRFVLFWSNLFWFISQKCSNCNCGLHLLVLIFKFSINLWVILCMYVRVCVFVISWYMPVTKSFKLHYFYN